MQMSGLLAGAGAASRDGDREQNIERDIGAAAFHEAAALKLLLLLFHRRRLAMTLGRFPSNPLIPGVCPTESASPHGIASYLHHPLRVMYF